MKFILYPTLSIFILCFSDSVAQRIDQKRPQMQVDSYHDDKEHADTEHADTEQTDIKLSSEEIEMLENAGKNNPTHKNLNDPKKDSIYSLTIDGSGISNPDATEIGLNGKVRAPVTMTESNRNKTSQVKGKDPESGLIKHAPGPDHQPPGKSPPKRKEKMGNQSTDSQPEGLLSEEKIDPQK